MSGTEMQTPDMVLLVLISRTKIQYNIDQLLVKTKKTDCNEN